MAVHHLETEVFTKVDLRILIVGSGVLKLNDVELKMAKSASHVVEALFRLYQDFVKAVIKSPGLLFFRQGTKNPCPRQSLRVPPIQL